MFVVSSWIVALTLTSPQPPSFCLLDTGLHALAGVSLSWYLLPQSPPLSILLSQRGVWWLAGRRCWLLGPCSSCSCHSDDLSGLALHYVGIWLWLLSLCPPHSIAGPQGTCSCPYLLCCLLVVQPPSVLIIFPLSDTIQPHLSSLMTFSYRCCRSWWCESVSRCLARSQHTAWCLPCRGESQWLIHSKSGIHSLVCLALQPPVTYLSTSSWCFLPLVFLPILRPAHELRHVSTYPSHNDAWQELPCCEEAGYRPAVGLDCPLLGILQGQDCPAFS